MHDRRERTSRIQKATWATSVAGGGLILAALLVPRPIHAQTVWRATVGAQSNDKGQQALAFLPNEIWIHAQAADRGRDLLSDDRQEMDHGHRPLVRSRRVPQIGHRLRGTVGVFS